MRRQIYALATVPFLLPALAASAWSAPAQTDRTGPVQLTSAQMDKVSAGFFEIDRSNTSVTMIEIFQRAYLLEPTANTLSCPGCYLLIGTPTISVGSQFGR